MLQPLMAATGAQFIAAESAQAGDITLRLDNKVVGAVRLPALHGALDRVIESVERELGGKLSELSRDRKQMAIRLLDERGAFILRRSVEDIADAMGVSRITVYNYLNALHR
jgi:predicted transcriptional regulator YheO